MAESEPRGAVVVHGGAGHIPDDAVAAYEAGVRAAALAAWAIVRAGGAALDAVEAAVRLMEDDPTFDAGRGSVLNREGYVEMDAGIMDGASRALGAVLAVRRVLHPITLARRILEDGDLAILAGAGAQAYARAHGLALVPGARLIVPRERARWEALRQAAAAHTAPPGDEPPGDTVGAVVLDHAGRIVAGTSTGGRAFKPAGRVGDSPIVGAGFFASAHGGASSTGDGESILRVGLARRAVELLDAPEALAPDAAAGRALAALAALPAEGGLILLDTAGRFAMPYNTPRMARAAVAPDGTLTSAV